MMSLEKLQQSLRSWTIFIIVLHSLSAVFGAIGLFGIFAIKSLLDSGKTIPNETPELLSQYRLITSPLSIFSSLVLFVIGLAILIISIKNLSNIKKGFLVNYLSYYLGFASIIISLAFSLLSKTFTPFSLIISLLYIALYAFTYKKSVSFNTILEENPIISQQ